MKKQKTQKQKKEAFSQRQIALIAGFGILAVAIVAVFSNFVVLESLVVADDAAATAENLTKSKGLFFGGIVGFIIIFLLELLVSWMLYLFFKQISRGISAAMALLRIVYNGFLGFSITYLFTAFFDLGAQDVMSDTVMTSITSFQDTWSIGYIFFGLHLVLLGYLIFRSGVIPKWIGALVVIAGLGYLVDAFGELVFTDYSLEIGLYTFIGELIFMFWLLFKGGKARPKQVD